MSRQLSISFDTKQYKSITQKQLDDLLRIANEGDENARKLVYDKLRKDFSLKPAQCMWLLIKKHFVKYGSWDYDDTGHLVYLDTKIGKCHFHLAEHERESTIKHGFRCEVFTWDEWDVMSPAAWQKIKKSYLEFIWNNHYQLDKIIKDGQAD